MLASRWPAPIDMGATPSSARLSSRLIGVGGPSAPPLSHPCNRVKLIPITPDHPLITRSPQIAWSQSPA